MPTIFSFGYNEITRPYFSMLIDIATLSAEKCIVFILRVLVTAFLKGSLLQYLKALYKNNQSQYYSFKVQFNPIVSIVQSALSIVDRLCRSYLKSCYLHPVHQQLHCYGKEELQFLI